MLKRVLIWTLIYCLTFAPANMAYAQGGIQADRSAPGSNQPQVLGTAGGVPQVNINTPNSKGLSHNKYQQFDVDSKGLILNNSNKNVQTQLGGWIEGNPNLAGGTAKTILNEVNSSKPSQLNGFVEVGGKKADVIIANPSGINVDGGGFINAGRATLTTGKPQVSGGQLTGYQVEGGRIEITGQGLNGTETDYTAIISQSASINAGIWANDLKVVTGRNTVSHNGEQVTALDPDAGEIQGVALDVSNLGGMYAGHIRLIGTDKGLGVRNAGDIVAQIGEVVITNDGRLENSGIIGGKQAVRAETRGSIKNTASGRIQSEGAVRLSTAKNLDNAGEIVANKTVTLKAGGKAVNTGTIQSAEELTLTTETEGIDNSGLIASLGESNISAGTDVLNTRDIQSGSGLNITAVGGQVDNQANILASEAVRITAGTRVINSGDIDSGAFLSITAQSSRLENTGGITGLDEVMLKARTEIINSGDIYSGRYLGLTTETGKIDSSGLIQVAQKGQVVSAADLTNSGRLLGAGELAVQAESGLLDNTGEITAQSLDLRAGIILNTGIFDGGSVVLRAKNELANVHTGSIFGDYLALEAGKILNGLPGSEVGIGTSGLIGARVRLDLAGRTITNREDGLIYSCGDIHFGGQLNDQNQAAGRAGLVENRSAAIDALGSIYATVVNFLNINDHYDTELRMVKDYTYRAYRFKGDETLYIHGETGGWNGGTDDKGWGGGHSQEDFYIYDVRRVEKDTFVIESRPGFISTGGDFVVDDDLTNDKSRIMSGGVFQVTTAIDGDTYQSYAGDKLKITGNFTNIAAVEPYIVTEMGSYHWTHVEATGIFGGHKRVHDSSQAYAPAEVITYNEKDVILNNAFPAQFTPGASGVPDGQAPWNDITISLTGPNSNLNLNLYTINPSSTSSYLVESNPRLTNYRTWLSSDFVISRMNSDPTVVHKRLGDGFYEQRLIREQIANLTGLRYLDGYNSDEDQYLGLMMAGLEFAEQYNLTPGISLSAEQMSRLTSDMVWLEYVTVGTAQGPMQVLAPKVYLAPGRESLISPGGALISAKAVVMDLGGGFENSGAVYGHQGVQVAAADIDNLGGTIAGKLVSLAALRDINNIGGVIIGQDLVSLTAGQDINIASRTQTTASEGAGHFGSRTAIDKAGMVMAASEGGHLDIRAGRDVDLAASLVGSAGSATIMAGNDLNVGTVETSYEYKAWADSKNSIHEKKRIDEGSQISAAGDLTMIAAGDLNITGSQVASAGQLALLAGSDISITEGREQSFVEEKLFVKDSGAFSTKTSTYENIRSTDQALGSTIAGESVIITAGNDFYLRGSSLAASEGLAISGGGHVDISGAANGSSNYEYQKTTRSGFTGGFSGGQVSVGYGKSEKGKESQSDNAWHSTSLVGSENGLVSIYSGRDTTISGSQVVAGSGDVIISGQNVTIDSQIDTYDYREKQWAKQSGFSLGLGLSGGGGGALSSGLDAYNNITSATNAKSDRAAALYGIAAAREVYDTARGLPGAVESLSALAQGNVGGSGLSLSIGFNKSSSQSKFESHDQVAVGSSITSGGDTIIVARGDGDGRGGDLNILGSTVEAGAWVTLAANKDLNLVSAEELSSFKSSNKSSSSGVSVGYQLGGGLAGLSGSAYANRSQGSGSGQSVSHAETVIIGGEGVQFASVGDTLIKGAQIIGGTVIGEVGGNLSIISEQDTDSQRFKQSSSGGGISVGMGGGGINYNSQKQKAAGDYAGVNEQSGIFAGDGGFNIVVGGHTSLVGAVTDSAAEASKNQLTTGSLSTEDIQNKSSYSAETSGWGLEIGEKAKISPSLPMKESGKDSTTTKSAIAEGTITITDEAAQLAKTGQTAEQVVASLNRDTANVHENNLDRNPDLQGILDKQAEIADAAGKAGKAVAQTAGDIAKSFTERYEIAKANEEFFQAIADDPNTSPEAKAKAQAELDYLNDPQARADYENWSEGGVYKAILQATGAALVAQIGNGEGLNAAMGAAASQLAAGKIEGLAQEIAKGMTDNQYQQGLITKTISNLISGGIGYVAAGETGSDAASTMDRYNRQLHPSEIKLIKDRYAKEYLEELLADPQFQASCASASLCDITEKDMIGYMTKAVLRNIDEYWAKALPPETEFDQKVYSYLKDTATSEGHHFTDIVGRKKEKVYFFTASEAQYKNPLLGISAFKDKDYLDFILEYGRPENRRNIAQAKADEFNNRWNAIFDMAIEHPVEFLKSLGVGLKEGFWDGEIALDLADVVEIKLFSSPYLDDLEKAYLEAKGKSTEGNYEHIFANDMNIGRLLNTIYGQSVSDFIYLEDAARTQALIISVIGMKSMLEQIKIKPGKKTDLGDIPTPTTITDKNIPTTGGPNSVVRQVDANGNLKAVRFYDENGRALKDIDYTNHGNPKTHPNVPHEHTWDWSDPDKPKRK